MNIQDSLTFLRCSRWALSDLGQKDPLLESNSIVSQSVKNDLSDYQIMSLLMCGHVPSEQSNIFEELMLFDCLKNQIRENYYFLSNYIDPIYLNEILENVSSVEPKGLTSKINVKKQKYDRINEISYWNNIKNKDTSICSEYASIVLSELVNGENDKSKSLKDQYLSVIFEEEKPQFMRNYWWAKAKSFTGHDPVFSRQTHDILKRYKDGQIDSDEMQNTLDAFRYKNDPKYLKNAVADRMRDLGPHGYRKSIGEKPTIAADHLSNMTTRALPAAANYVSQNKGKLAAGALAAVGIYAAYKGIKKMLERKKSACNGLSGPQKSQCIQRANIDATKSQIQSLTRLIPGCAKTENPEDCKNNIKSKIMSLQNRLKSGG